MTDPYAGGPLYRGDRVVVRYRVDTAGFTLTDVTGLVVAEEPTLTPGQPLVIDGTGPKEAGARVVVDRADVVSVRLLSYRTVRNSDIRRLAARVAAAASPAETATVDGWLLRAGCPGPRDESAVPIEAGARLDGASRRAITDWYATRERPATIALPERLVPDSHVTGRRIGGIGHVLVDPTSSPADPEWAVCDADDVAAGTRLRARGYRLHHRIRHVGLDG